MTQEKAIKIWVEGTEDALDTCNKIISGNFRIYQEMDKNRKGII